LFKRKNGQKRGRVAEGNKCRPCHMDTRAGSEGGANELENTIEKQRKRWGAEVVRGQNKSPGGGNRKHPKGSRVQTGDQTFSEGKGGGSRRTRTAMILDNGRKEKKRPEERRQTTESETYGSPQRRSSETLIPMERGWGCSWPEVQPTDGTECRGEKGEGKHVNGGSKGG